MGETLGLVLAALGGGALGAIFFGGLWWTVRKALASSKPAFWMLTSGLLRMGITLAGFYVVAGGDWQRLLACLAGFVMARQIVTRLTRVPGSGPTPPTQEAHHAP